MLSSLTAGAQAPPPDQPQPGPGTTEPTATPAPAPPPPPAVKTPTLGPTREIKLADDTWFRFAVQVQAWFKAAQDRIKQADGSDGGFALDFYCRRCRFFVTGSVVKNVFFNFLFEAGNFGKADTITGVKNFGPPVVLDAYAVVKFDDAFMLSAGNILLPLTRNGTQPTTTYLSIDNANVDTTPILQGNSTVLRDLGVQINGFFLEDHLEYRVGLFQGSRAAAHQTTTGDPPVTTTTQLAGHNMFRLVAMLQGNLWDPEKGYVNGGHYFGRKKVLGASAAFDFQPSSTDDPPAAGTSKDPYIGFSAAAFINYPLSGSADPKNGGDEVVGLLQFGIYNGGGAVPVDPTHPGTYPAVLKQINFLGEAAYYNKELKLSFFGKFEMRQIDGGYADATKAANNVMWIAGGLKYYIAEHMTNFGLQYERVQFPDATSAQQKGTHNITLQMQLLLY
jgi:hypothetical protein